jgi:uncharacterized protein YqeY
MSIVEKLKAESIGLRKAKNPVAASIQFALSEIEKVGKNSGNRATTDDEAIRVVQKLIATIDENLKHADESRAIQFNFEKRILESVLPQMASEKDVIAFLKAKYSSENMPKKGEIMKALRDEFGALIDMKRAGQIVTELYGV